jgi:hypothetical protein
MAGGSKNERIEGLALRRARNGRARTWLASERARRERTATEEAAERRRKPPPRYAANRPTDCSCRRTPSPAPRRPPPPSSMRGDCSSGGGAACYPSRPCVIASSWPGRPRWTFDGSSGPWANSTQEPSESTITIAEKSFKKTIAKKGSLGENVTQQQAAVDYSGKNG